MVDLVRPDLEFYEVLNAFPALSSYFENLHFKIQNVKEGISLYEYFESSDHMSKREVELLVRKINIYLNGFLEKTTPSQQVNSQLSEELLEEE